MAKLNVAIDRAKAGTALDLFGQFWDNKQAGETWTEAAQREVADRALERYQGHIRAAFERHGIVLAPGEVIDSAVLLRVIREKTGLDVPALTPDGVAGAVRGQVSQRLSDSLGVDLGGAGDVDSIKAALIDSAKNAVATGKPNALITKTMIRKMRAAKTWEGSGLSDLERKKMLSRWYQKKYRRSNREVWD